MLEYDYQEIKDKFDELFDKVIGGDRFTITTALGEPCMVLVNYHDYELMKKAAEALPEIAMALARQLNRS